MRPPKDFSEYIYKAENGCWEWNGHTRYGYGFFWFNGKDIRAHRYSYEKFVGKIPRGMFVCHKCDNKKCVNPEHLFIGTEKDNTQDSIEKNRFRPKEYRHKSTYDKRLPKDKVIEIYVEYYSTRMSCFKLSVKHGVDRKTIYRIIHKKTHKKLLSEFETRSSLI